MSRNLKQTITRWQATKTFGGVSYTVPVTLKARWETIVELFKTPAGDEETSNAKVMVESILEVGDYIFLGESSALDPRIVDGAFEVRGYSEMPDLRRVRTERVAHV